jgi:hypothetical protein
VSAVDHQNSIDAEYVMELVFLQDIVTVKVIPMIAWESAVVKLK